MGVERATPYLTMFELSLQRDLFLDRYASHSDQSCSRETYGSSRPFKLTFGMARVRHPTDTTARLTRLNVSDSRTDLHSSRYRASSPPDGEAVGCVVCSDNELSHIGSKTHHRPDCLDNEGAEWPHPKPTFRSKPIGGGVTRVEMIVCGHESDYIPCER